MGRVQVTLIVVGAIVAGVLVILAACLLTRGGG